MKLMKQAFRKNRYKGHMRSLEVKQPGKKVILGKILTLAKVAELYLNMKLLSLHLNHFNQKERKKIFAFNLKDFLFPISKFF